MKQEQGINKQLLSKAHEITELDKLVRYMTSPPGSIELTEKEMAVMKRLNYTYDHLQEYSDKELRNMLMNKFDVCMSTAYNDIDNTYKLHPQIGKLRRDVFVYFLTQYSKRNLRDAFTTGNVSKQTKAIEAAAKVAALIKDEEPVDWAKIQPNNYYLVINQKVGDTSKSLKIDMNKVHELSAEDTTLLQEQLFDHFAEETIEILTKDE